jgi:hypothetical protein
VVLEKEEENQLERLFEKYGSITKSRGGKYNLTYNKLRAG